MRQASRRSAWVIAPALVCVTFAAGAADAQWPQMGGPNRNFTVTTTGLADEWPEGGPERLWHRTLGDGYSSIVVDGDVLYTMYASDTSEWTIALDAKTGKTIWQHENFALFKGTEFGPGPHATPLVCGDRLFVVGAKTVLHCLDKKTGAVLWTHDLPAKFGAPVPHFGYACSPIAYKNTVILPVDRVRPKEDGPSTDTEVKADKPGVEPVGQSLMAFDQATGKVVWRSQDYPIDYSSPILITFEGQDQLVLIMRKDIIGVDPNDGALLWHHSFTQVPDENIAMPVWNGKDLLFFSAAYNSGSRVLKLAKEGDKTTARELWYSRKLRILLGNAIQIGDHVYGFSGDFGSTFLVGMNIETGKPAWRQRGFKKATCVYADEKLIALEEDGHLVLATLTPTGATVHSRYKITEHQSWTAPTLVGTTLYVRDRKHIMALDLGEAKPAVKATDALEVLQKSAEAIKKVEMAKYKARYWGTGWVADMVPQVEGAVALGRPSAQDIPRFRTDIELTPPKSSERMKMLVGSDGDIYYLVNPKTKTIHADMDDAVMGSRQRGIQRVLMSELVATEPLAEEMKAEKLVVEADTDVGGEVCHRIRVRRADRREVIWFISKRDWLPRRLDRLYKNKDGKLGTTQLELADLTVESKLDPSVFALTVPDGYRKTDEFAP